MNQKTGLQVIMVLIIILISLWFYLNYFTKNFEDVKETKVEKKLMKIKIATQLIL